MQTVAEEMEELREVWSNEGRAHVSLQVGWVDLDGWGGARARARAGASARHARHGAPLRAPSDVRHLALSSMRGSSRSGAPLI